MLALLSALYLSAQTPVVLTPYPNAKPVPWQLKVPATLYDQSTPPYFLADRYQTLTPATARLRYLVDSMTTLEQTDFANWKILVCSARK